MLEESPVAHVLFAELFGKEEILRWGNRFLNIVQLEAVEPKEHFLNPFFAALNPKKDGTGCGRLPDHDGGLTLGSCTQHLQLELWNVVLWNGRCFLEPTLPDGEQLMMSVW